MKDNAWPQLGCGVGLRNEHYSLVTSEWPEVDWFEVISENFMDSSGRPLSILEKVRERYPVVLHGTSLSISSTDELDPTYLKRLKALVDHIEPSLVSDHLCWSGVDGHKLHDLLPVPYNEESLKHVTERIKQVQDYLGRQILIENVSTYLTYQHSTIPEWEFIAELARRAGCGILLDLNNIYVNAFNHQFNALDYLDGIPGELVGQFHLAGHTDKGDYLFDTHSGEVINPVWELYQEALKRWGKVSTLIEWDENIPEFPRIVEEANKARQYYDQVPNVRTNAKAKTPYGGEKAASSVSLVETQRWFKSKMQPIESPGDLKEIPLNKQRNTPGEERLDVYAEGYTARIHEALKEAYPAVSHLLGEGNFAHLASEYARTYPSQNYNLSLAGIRLPEYFSKANELTEKFPFLKDLAELEWLVTTSFHIRDEAPLDPTQIQQIAPDEWEHCRLFLRSSVMLYSSEWPVFDLWKVRNTPIKEISVKVEDNPQNVLVWREGTDVKCAPLENDQFEMLKLLSEKATLGQAIEKYSEADPSNLPPLQAWFTEWNSRGLFRGFEVTTPSQK